jgi:hypothetical protein
MGSRPPDTPEVIGLIASRRLSSRVALLGRLSFIDNHPPSLSGERAGSAFSNPLLGATFLRTRDGGLRQSLFVAATAPIGSGGGPSPSAAKTAALARAIATRSAMDNAMFATNYFALIGGAGLARVTKAATVQAEVTVLQLFRMRAAPRRRTAADQLHGRAPCRPIVPARVLGGRRASVSALAHRRSARSFQSRQARETVTFAFGPRFHFKLGKGSKWIRPGLSLTLPLDEPLSGQRYRIVQVDVPVSF